MDSSSPKQFIQVGEQQLALPDGVSVSEWGLEKVTSQNPRLRAFLGCIRLLGEVMESNYAVLHCSPERLQEVWRKVRRVADLIRTRIGPLLATASNIPDLEVARKSAEEAFIMLEATILRDLEKFPENVAAHRLMELRKLLCVSIGQLHSFLQDTFGDLAASDPRSGMRDADYFLSRRFTQDIDEAEWLHSTVGRLHKHLVHLARLLPSDLSERARQLREEKTIPHHHTWEEVKTFLDLLLNVLTPKLREVLSLRGIRFSEMEIMDRYALEIPIRCRQLIEIHDMGSQAIEEIQANVGLSHTELEQCGKDLKTCHSVISRRMAAHMTEIDRIVQDLVAFVPLWLQGIEKRRALMFKHWEEAIEESGENTSS
jgi:hypothetical protein